MQRIEYGPEADEQTRNFYSKLDDNNGRGYSIEEAAEQFAKLTTANIIREDIEIPKFYRSPGIQYGQIKKEIKTTKRNAFIKELKEKGYTANDIKYVELQDGKHDVPTWARAFPDFLKWGWGK